jgi:dipeptidyl aminopeptidase/acylaminoacyl peptidase
MLAIFCHVIFIATPNKGHPLQIIMQTTFFRQLTQSWHSAVALSALLFISSVMAAEVTRPKAELFFSNSEVAQVSLSPDGKFIGMLINTKERVQLAVMDLSTNRPQIIAGYSNVDIAEFHWVNSQRIVYSTGDRKMTADQNKYHHGLFAVNRDGTESRTLVDREYKPEFTTGTAIKSRVLPANTYFFDVDRSNLSDDIFVVQDTWDSSYDFKALSLLRLNTKTAQTSSFNRAGDTTNWLIDQTGTPRINVTHRDGVSAIHYLDPANDKWRKLIEYKAYLEEGFTPYAFGPDDSLYVVANLKKNTSSLYKYDLKKNEIVPQALVSIDGYDFNGSMVFDYAKKKAVGVHFQSDAKSTLWLDDELKNIQKIIDELLPATINTLSFARNIQTNKILINAYSDVRPSSFFLYDTDNKKLTSIGDMHPKINSEKMSTMDLIHFKARDGLTIPTYVSLPFGANKKNLPMVLLVHGGPYIRGGTWEWDPEVQFLTSRGYAVLQPEFRGSTGYGVKHFQAGWKEWGLAMQDDVADAAKWAIAQGIADPKRICIAGASYGGYATLMGLAKNPELFKCGVNWVGVTDLNLLYEESWSNDASAEWQRFGMPILIGDKIKDAERLKANSPVYLADKIKQPLLMAYGRADRRVPIEHGISFRDKVAVYNKKVEWIEYQEEGHGWKLLKNRLDFWTRVEKFLDENIGTPN